MHTHEVARRLAALGHEVTVLTTDMSGELPREEQVDGIHIKRVRAWPRRRDYYLAPAVYPVITGGAWDLVHCQGWQTFVAPLAMFAAWRAGIPYAVTFHTGGHSSRLRNAIRGLQRRLLRPLLAGATRLVAVSDFEADLFANHLHLPREQFAVIPNGSQLVMESAPVQIDSTLILSVGRLERYKGHQRVIAALPEILEQCPDAHLRILGSGPFEAVLRQLAAELGVADRVEIGSIPVADRGGMARTLAGSALVVLLSDFEAHPIAVMEALALGRPVLVTYTSGLAELADRGLVASIPLASTTHEIAQSVLENLRHPRQAGNIVLPTWEDCVTDLLAVYDQALRESACVS